VGHERAVAHQLDLSLMYSVDFNEIERMQIEGDWEEAAREMVGAAKRLKSIRDIRSGRRSMMS
jgi:aspartate/glutamate racemase